MTTIRIASWRNWRGCGGRCSSGTVVSLKPVGRAHPRRGGNPVAAHLVRAQRALGDRSACDLKSKKFQAAGSRHGSLPIVSLRQTATHRNREGNLRPPLVDRSIETQEALKFQGSGCEFSHSNGDTEASDLRFKDYHSPTPKCRARREITHRSSSSAPLIHRTPTVVDRQS